MIHTSKSIIKKILASYSARQKKRRIKKYIANGRAPWSKGYEEYKWEQIKINLENKNLAGQLSSGKLPLGYGKGLDERIVEYPWIYFQLSDNCDKLLDAGSTFNFEKIIHSEKVAKKELTIYTFFPEPVNFNTNKISYHYGDLRCLPFRDQWFDEVVCQSTLEHIDMDNSIYGYSLDSKVTSGQKSYEYMTVVNELERCLKKTGSLYITVPFGRYEQHGFFQQFDNEMVDQINFSLAKKGKVELTYLKYSEQGWIFSNQTDCEHSYSFNPGTGIGKGDDGAAHSRAICCIKFTKES